MHCVNFFNTLINAHTLARLEGEWG